LYLEFAKSTTANHTVQHQSSVTKKQGRKTQIHPCTFLQFSFESTMLDVHFITKQQKVNNKFKENLNPGKSN